MDDISYTAQWTAAARALESERPDGLFRDNFFIDPDAGPAN